MVNKIVDEFEFTPVELGENLFNESSGQLLIVLIDKLLITPINPIYQFIIVELRCILLNY